MGVDKFGRSNSFTANSLPRGPPGVGFKLTNDGDFDINNKRIKFVCNPVDAGDVINKQYFDDKLQEHTDLAIIPIRNLIKEHDTFKEGIYNIKKEIEKLTNSLDKLWLKQLEVQKKI